MVRFTVWTFPNPYDAEAVVTRLKNLCVHELIRIGDAAVVTWPHGRPVPEIVLPEDLPCGWKLDNAFWEFLIGVLFHCDYLTHDPATGTNKPGSKLADMGISTELLDEVRGRIVAGTSALLLFVEAEVVRRIVHAFDGMPFVLVDAPISSEQEQWLRTTFSPQSDA